MTGSSASSVVSSASGGAISARQHPGYNAYPGAEHPIVPTVWTLLRALPQASVQTVPPIAPLEEGAQSNRLGWFCNTERPGDLRSNMPVGEGRRELEHLESRKLQLVAAQRLGIELRPLPPRVEPNCFEREPMRSEAQVDAPLFSVDDDLELWFGEGQPEAAQPLEHEVLEVTLSSRSVLISTREK